MKFVKKNQMGFKCIINNNEARPNVMRESNIKFFLINIYMIKLRVEYNF